MPIEIRKRRLRRSDETEAGETVTSAPSGQISSVIDEKSSSSDVKSSSTDVKSSSTDVKSLSTDVKSSSTNKKSSSTLVNIILNPRTLVPENSDNLNKSLEELPAGNDNGQESSEDVKLSENVDNTDDTEKLSDNNVIASEVDTENALSDEVTKTEQEASDEAVARGSDAASDEASNAVINEASDDSFSSSDIKTTDNPPPRATDSINQLYEGLEDGGAVDAVVDNSGHTIDPSLPTRSSLESRGAAALTQTNSSKTDSSYLKQDLEENVSRTEDISRTEASEDLPDPSLTNLSSSLSNVSHSKDENIEQEDAISTTAEHSTSKHEQLDPHQQDSEHLPEHEHQTELQDSKNDVPNSISENVVSNSDYDYSYYSDVLDFGDEDYMSEGERLAKMMDEPLDNDVLSDEDYYEYDYESGVIKIPFNYSGLESRGLETVPRAWDAKVAFLEQVGMRLYMFVPAIIGGVLLGVLFWFLTIFLIRSYGTMKLKVFGSGKRREEHKLEKIDRKSLPIRGEEVLDSDGRRHRGKKSGLHLTSFSEGSHYREHEQQLPEPEPDYGHENAAYVGNSLDPDLVDDILLVQHDQGDVCKVPRRSAADNKMADADTSVDRHEEVVSVHSIVSETSSSSGIGNSDKGSLQSSEKDSLNCSHRKTDFGSPDLKNKKDVHKGETASLHNLPVNSPPGKLPVTRATSANVLPSANRRNSDQ